MAVAENQLLTAENQLLRCPWAEKDEFSRKYHDEVWGRPCHDERELFKMLILEGFQAGLSWVTILKKQAAFEAAFDGFDPSLVARYGAEKIERLMNNSGIIRNRRKIAAAVTNAQAVLRLGSLDDFLWSYVGGVPIVGNWERQEDMPVNTPLSDEISGELKRRGFTFVGSTIVYSYLQAVGVVNDHMAWCEISRYTQ
ncbi:MAG: DNA-3-methyladenine glycosylase I [Oscillospiraceae bacterium]|jgi:DNA-3-methyladenine glycosylase I|nr:DNA-3-methyladenine glycosylase I [Oscillospiraceae bacterium]